MFGLVKSQNHLPRQHTGRVLLFVHGPDDIARLRNRRLEFSPAIACRFEYRREVTDVPVLEDD